MSSRDDVLNAIDRFRTHSGTVVSLRTLFPDVDIDSSTGTSESETPRGMSLGAAHACAVR